MMDTEKLEEVVSAAEKKMDAVTSIDWWMWIAVVEFLLIVFLLFVRKRQKRGEEMAQFKKEAISILILKLSLYVWSIPDCRNSIM